MNLFSSIPVKKPRLTPHNLGHPVLFTPEFGQLTPVQCEKLIPSDISLCGLVRQEQFAALATKLYQDFRIKTETFFVPSRLLWSEFGDFFADEDNIIVHPRFTVRQIVAFTLNRFRSFLNATHVSDDFSFIQSYFANLFGPSSLLAHLFGFLGDDAFWKTEFTVSWLSPNFVPSYKTEPAFLDKELDFLRVSAYFFIMTNYYFDETLHKYLIDTYEANFLEPVSNITDYSNRLSYWLLKLGCYYAGYNESPFTSIPWATFKAVFVQNLNLFRGFAFRCWPKDYFAGALPFRQRGSTVDIPMSQGTIDVQLDDATLQNLIANTALNNVGVELATDQTGVESGYKRVKLTYQHSSDSTTFATDVQQPLNITVSGIRSSIEDFRTAYQLQEWLEKNARGGTRYKEQIFSHFGVHTKDYRLDRPEFIFGTTNGVNYGNVFTTFQDTAGNGVPAESVTAISAGGKSRYAKYFSTEHGYYITLYTVYPKPMYAYGLYRQGFELDKFDYPWPEFQHLGEQEVYQCEIDSRDTRKDHVFGYQPRYSQYKCRMAEVHGEFVDKLPTFTAYRDFAQAALDGRWISMIPQYSNLYRIFNYTNVDYAKVYVYMYIDHRVLRPIDYYGVPRLQL